MGVAKRILGSRLMGIPVPKAIMALVTPRTPSQAEKPVQGVLPLDYTTKRKEPKRKNYL